MTAGISLLIVGAGPAAAQAANRTVRVSVSDSGGQGTESSQDPAISTDGRYVAFSSSASTLVPGDTNASSDVFVRDLRRGVTTRISVSSTGAQAEGSSSEAAISANGRFVAFLSTASNLAPGDSNGNYDVLVRDRWNGTTSLVTLSSSGAHGDSYSFGTPAISRDGRFVAFTSYATNLVPGDTNEEPDIFLRDRQTTRTIRVNVSDTGAQANRGSIAPAISANGRYITFASSASNLVPGDTNDGGDVFVRDLIIGDTRLASVSSTGVQGNGYTALHPDISADGRFVAYTSPATNLVPADTGLDFDVFLRDARTGTTSQVCLSTAGEQAQGGCWDPEISADGRYVTFQSEAANLVPGDTNGATDVFVRDRQAGTTTRVSVSASGAEGTGYAGMPSISGNGRRIAFTSGAADLVRGDTNDTGDVFVNTRRP
jgi:Tol biopolymer transport system component